MAEPSVTELKGSRQEKKDGKTRYGMMIYAATSAAATGGPVVGSTYFTPLTGGSDSGNTGRRCVSFELVPEKLPGLFYWEAQFASLVGYSETP